jgi:hypothetical protein
VIVDQLCGLARLPVRLCWDHQVPTAYLHGAAVPTRANSIQVKARAIRRNAFVLADAARAHPNRVARDTPFTHQCDTRSVT